MMLNFAGHRLMWLAYTSGKMGRFGCSRQWKDGLPLSLLAAHLIQQNVLQDNSGILLSRLVNSAVDNFPGEFPIHPVIIRTAQKLWLPGKNPPWIG